MRKVITLLLLAVISQQYTIAQKSDFYFIEDEQFYVHTDKVNYLPGDEMWLKMYVTYGNLAYSKSTSLKVELINTSKEVLVQKILPIINASASCNFTIPKTCTAGYYLLRIYGNWSTLFNSQQLYQKNILVGFTTTVQEQNTTPTPIIKLKPESNNFLVADGLNMLYYQAMYSNSKPLSGSIFITNTAGDTVTNQPISSTGFGKFGLYVNTNESYKAFYKTDKLLQEISFPTIKNEGTILQVLTNKTGILFSVNPKNTQPTSLVAMSGDNLLFKFPLNSATASKGLLPANLPNGYIHLLVLDQTNKLLTQKSIYVNKIKTALPTINTTQFSNHYRAKNELEILTNSLQEGSLSISITNAEQNISVSNYSTINEQILYNNGLTYDVNLLAMDDNTVEALVNIASSKTLFYPDSLTAKQTISKVNTAYLTISGTATTNGKKIYPNAEMTFIIQTKDSSINYLDATADEKGNFMLEGLIFKDSASINYQANAKKHKDKFVEIIQINQGISSQLNMPINIDEWLTATLHLPKLFVPANLSNYTALDTNNTTLKAVTVSTKKKSAIEVLDDKYTKGVFAGNARSVIDFINNPPPNGSNIFQYLQGRYSYLTVSGSMPNYQVQLRNAMNLRGDQIYMALFLDEMQVESSTLLTVPIQNIAYIKIFTTGFLGITGSGGALAVYTKKAEDMPFTYNSALKRFMVEGYANNKDFNIIEYATNQESFIKKDNRITLYWNEELNFFNDKTKLPVVFYNSDNCKKFKISIMGLTDSGEIFYTERIIE